MGPHLSAARSRTFQRSLTVFSAVVFIILAVAEILHFARGEPWPSFTVPANWVVFILAPVWLMAAASLLVDRWKSQSLMLTAFGCAFAVGHFAVLRLGQANAAYLYLLGAIAITGAMTARHRIRERSHDSIVEVSGLASPRKAA
jgi:hypothetical protein